MAGLSEYGDGLKRIGFNLEANGARQFIRLGAVDRRTAEETRLRIGKLIAAKQLNISIDPETAAWLAHTSEELHRRIAATGLVPPRQKAEVVTMEQLAGRFEAMVSSTSKPETQLFYGHTLRNTFRRPKRSRTAPANIAPSTQPTRVELAAQTDHGRSQGEFGLHKTDSPGRDRGIKTEQPSAQRRHQADHGQI